MDTQKVSRGQTLHVGDANPLRACLGRPLISPSRESKRVGDVRSVQSSHSPAFSHREPQQERHPSVNNGLAPSTSMDRLPASPPARKTNSLSVGSNTVHASS
jgi:hypothetical protein